LKAAEETDILSHIEQHELDLPPEELIEKLTQNHFVTVFAKSYCKYSKRVKTFFKNKNIDFKAVDLDTLGEHGKDIQAKLLEITGQSTVPNVSVNGKFIGKIFITCF
jgi:glutaredoxin